MWLRWTRYWRSLVKQSKQAKWTLRKNLRPFFPKAKIWLCLFVVGFFLDTCKWHSIIDWWLLAKQVLSFRLSVRYSEVSYINVLSMGDQKMHPKGKSMFSVIIQNYNRLNVHTLCQKEKWSIKDPFWGQKCMSIHYMRIWHWKSHWKVQLHWNHTEKLYKSYNYTAIFSFITLKFVCYCYSRMLIPYPPLTISVLLISFVLSPFSVTLVFQCDFQCHNSHSDYLLLTLI